MWQVIWSQNRINPSVASENFDIYGFRMISVILLWFHFCLKIAHSRHIIFNVTIICVLSLPNSVGNLLPIMDSPKPVSQHYRILLATHCRLWTYQQLYTRTFSVTLFGKLTTYHIFLEGHKILRNLPYFCTVVKSKGKI